jgi:predicted naringenin-chalcone synthase
MQLAHQLDAQERRKLDFLYRKSGIDSRHSVLEDFQTEEVSDFTFFPKNKELHPFPGTAARMQVFEEKGPELAEQAVRSALQQAEVEANSLTHLILISCTGMVAPGLELDLMRRLGIPSSVERYCIHFMGCYAAFTGLRLADQLVKANPKSRVLVVSVELCTLHFQKEYTEDNLLANSLFGDGAAAALVMQSEKGLQIKNYFSEVLWEGEKDMAWKIGDFGFEMRLSQYIPSLLNQGIRRLRDLFEAKFNFSKVRHVAIHPGGKQILIQVQEAFGLSPEVNRHALEVLRTCGNMSSASILFVLERMLQDSSIQGDILALGFGPGLTLETTHYEKR